MPNTNIAKLLIVASIAVLPSRAFSDDAKQTRREEMYQKYLEFSSYVKGGQVKPNWTDGNSFWYSEGPPENTVIWKVDAVANTKERLAKVPADSKVEKGPPVRRGEVLSPNGKWVAGYKQRNVYVRSTTDDRIVPLTTDGETDFEWRMGALRWSPDSSKLVATKVDVRAIPKIPIVEYVDNPGQVEWIHYPRAGDPYWKYELSIIDIASGDAVSVDKKDKSNIRPKLKIIGWAPDGSAFLFFNENHYEWSDLDAGRVESKLFAADPATGTVRALVGYKGFFDWGGFVDNDRFVVIVRGNDSYIALHGRDGKLIQRLTPQRVQPSNIVTIDQDAGWIYFTEEDSVAKAENHLYRVNLQGEMLARLSEASGHHDFVFTPSKKFFLDTHSTVTRAPSVELRRSDGKLLRTLSVANIDGLKELNWTPPETFVVKSADGQSELYGVLYKPFDFNANKKYPVIDSMGPTRNRFVYSDLSEVGAQALAQLGVVVIKVNDTPPIIGDVGRKETADHVAALQQLNETRRFMDLGRVGVEGGSILGYFALHAMLTAPDVYDVCLASAPVCDIADRIGNQWWVGRPPKGNEKLWDSFSHYRRAGNLKGKLLLVHGTSDRYVPFFHTMKLADALNRAGKTYELMVLPGRTHMSAEVYDNWRIRRFLVENLNP